MLVDGKVLLVPVIRGYDLVVHGFPPRPYEQKLVRPVDRQPVAEMAVGLEGNFAVVGEIAIRAAAMQKYSFKLAVDGLFVEIPHMRDMLRIAVRRIHFPLLPPP